MENLSTTECTTGNCGACVYCRDEAFNRNLTPARTQGRIARWLDRFAAVLFA